jgi:hypothetical protein
MQWQTVSNLLHIDIITWMSVIIRRGMDWVTEFFWHFMHTTRKSGSYSATANLRALQFIVTHTSVLNILRSPLAVSWQQMLT